MLDERHAVEQARQGNESAWRSLYETYADFVFRLAMQKLGDRDAALDVVQETFIRASTAIDGFRGDSAFKSWIARIAINEATNQIRRQARRREAPLEVVYIFYSLEANRRVRLRVRLAEDVEVPSVTPVFAGANWPEREAYDMFGIRFAQHPDLTRILLWEGFNGYPLRKEFPVEGIDTGAAIYPEFYEDSAGPVAGTGTGWKPPEPPAEAAEPEEKTAEDV